MLYIGIVYIYVCVYIWLILTRTIFKTNIAQCKLLPLTGNA